jgi:hypothetical protein
MHRSKLCASAAIVVMASATAALGAGNPVNIADPNAATRMAKVEPGNRLAVQDVPPTSYYHSAGLTIGDCTQIAAAPPGKALIVRQVKLNVFNADTPASIYANADCSLAGIVGNTTVPVVGHDTITFDPGLAIPSGGVLSAHNNTANPMNAFVDGYTVASGVAPVVAGQTIQVSGGPNVQR